ncbi:MAG TPA: ACP S-malonyltransferase, partial [Acidimicrobiales bacterium]|nr:ACP S-malonyltransferase [Acidimicrobiales bacterium]
FPGQGSQRPGMGGGWVDHPSWEVVDEAAAMSGRDVAHLLLRADQDELKLTANAQLATYVLSLVVLDAIERIGVEPTVCAGHSLGEYSALTASGALAFEDGIRLVVERGDAMHEAAEDRPGTMAAVLGVDDDTVEAACQRAEGEVWVANYNAEGQVVVAGDPEAVARAGELAKSLGARKVMPFPVAGAFHTPLMAPARARLRKALAETPFNAPEVPVVANVDARVHDDPGDWPGLLSAQLCSPVRWRQTLAALEEMGTSSVVEVGPGGVLTGLARRALPAARPLAVASPADLDPLVDAIAGSTWHAFAAAHQGETLYTSERVVVSPAAGVFEPHGAVAAPGPGNGGPGATGGPVAGADPAAGSRVAVGDLLGTVGTAEVRTPFAGEVVGYLVHPGERVTSGQPVAWLRVSVPG